MLEMTGRIDNPQDSLKKRYFYKFFFSVVSFLFNLISQAIIPRVLGPAGYGDFNFLTNFFTQAAGFFDSGTSTCFYTKLSQRPKEQGLISFYLIFSAIVLAILAISVSALVMTGAYSAVWPNQQILYIYLALGLAFIMWLAQVVSLVPDAYGQTVLSEKLKMLQRLVAIIILLVLFLTKCLDLTSYFLYSYVVTILFIFLLGSAIVKSGYFLIDKIRIPAQRAGEYLSEFWKYSHPLFAYAVVVAVAGIFDRWFLQVYGGSAEQGFYSLSYQIGATCFLVTGAMTPLFMRELAIAHDREDIDKMKQMFRRYVPLLYALTAYFCCFIAVEADKIVYIFGGSGFKGAVLGVAIMAFYPMHQTYGQLSSSVFYATGQTKLYRNIGIIFTLAGLPLTYFLIAPSDRMGLSAGAVGLAIKMVLINIVGVNVQLYFNAKKLCFNFWRYLGHQIMTVGIFIVFALAAELIMSLFFKSVGRIGVFLASGALYSVLVMASVYFFPVILGLNRNDITALLYRNRVR